MPFNLDADKLPGVEEISIHFLPSGPYVSWLLKAASRGAEIEVLDPEVVNAYL